jgi:hypothetical protein
MSTQLVVTATAAAAPAVEPPAAGAPPEPPPFAYINTLVVAVDWVQETYVGDADAPGSKNIVDGKTLAGYVATDVPPAPPPPPPPLVLDPVPVSTPLLPFPPPPSTKNFTKDIPLGIVKGSHVLLVVLSLPANTNTFSLDIFGMLKNIITADRTS